MQTVGDYLKKERVARNISLNEVAEFTKISKLYLDCLEKDEYKKIPGEPYVKGYISSYAECVGISDHKALKLYDSFQEKKRHAEEEMAEVVEGNKRRRLPFFSLKTNAWLVLALLTPIILAVGGYYTFFRKQEKAAADKRIQGADKSIRKKLSSENEPNFMQKQPAGGFFKTIDQAGLEKNPVDTKSTKKYDAGISPSPATGEIRPTKISDEAAIYPPVYDSAPVKELQDPGNYQTPLESDLEVVEAAACSSLNGRTPQGCAKSFAWSTDRVYIWTLIQCESPPAAVRHVYYFKGEKVSDIELNVNSSHWRTWSYKTLSDESYIGPWRVDITSEKGRLLKSVEFEVR